MVHTSDNMPVEPAILDGNPGSGKTTLALPYLREGIRLGETRLHCSCGLQGFCEADP